MERTGRKHIVTLLSIIAFSAPHVVGEEGGKSAQDLDEMVRRIYIPAGDVFQSLPELIRQLEIVAGGDLGHFTSKGRPIREGDLDQQARRAEEWATYQRTRRLPTFAIESGTRKEVLDAYCEQVPWLMWSQKANGVVIFRREAAGSERIRRLLAEPIPPVQLGGLELDLLLIRLRKTVLKHNPHATAGDENHTLFFTNGTEQPWVGWLAAMPWGDAKSDLGEASTLREALDKLVLAGQNSYWLAMSGEPLAINGSADNDHVVISTWSDERQGLSLKELIHAVDPVDQDIYSYRDVTARVHDAWREIRRRQHFEPKAVREAILRERMIESIVNAQEGQFDAATQIEWVYRLDDPMLTERAFELSRGLSDPGRRSDLLVVLTPPWATDSREQVLVFWHELAENDPLPSVREMAQEILDADVAIQARRDSGG